MPPPPQRCRAPLPAALALAGVLGARAASAQAPEAPPPPAPAPAATGPAIAGIDVDGSIDPPGRLEGYLALLAPTGRPFVEAGPADESGTPVSTIPTLSLALERLGYTSVIETKVERTAAGAPAVRLLVHLRAADRVRHIFVEGNWPIRQDEIISRLTLRAGQALPLPGPDRDARLERERQSVLAFLHDQGYFEAQVDVALETTDRVPSPANLLLKIDIGPGYLVGAVTVEGNTALPSESITRDLHHGDWRFLMLRPLPFQRSLLREDLAALTDRYRKLGYAWARATSDFDPGRSVDRQRREVSLGLSVQERKRVEVTFEGNQRFDADDLREHLTIFARGAYDNFETKASAEAIEKFYRSKGHMFARVTFRSDSSQPDVHRIAFKVVEGPRLKVRGVSFTGNHAFPEDRLADVVTVKPFPLLGWLGIGEGGYASKQQLQADQARIAEFYRVSGYPNTTAVAEIAPAGGRWQRYDAAIEADPAWSAADALHVRFVVKESPRVDVAEIRFESIDGTPLPYTPEFLRESLDMKVGAPLEVNLLRGDGERLRRLLGDAGYQQVTVDFDYPEDKTPLVLTWLLALGPKVHVGPMFVRGNFLTSEGTVRRWTLLRPGDLLTTTALERSQRNLALIQIFNNAGPISLPPETQVGDVVPMVVEVEERHDHWGVVRVGGGASTEQATPGGDFPLGAYGAVAYEHRNLFGQGWLFLARAERGNSLTRADAEGTDPRFLGTPYRLGIAVSYLRQATVRLGDIRSGGGSIGFARELYPGVDSSLRYGLRRTFHTEFLIRSAGPFAEQRSVNIPTTVGGLTFALEWQRLDHPLAPTRGFKVQGSVELATPALSFRAGEDTFVKTGLRGVAVVPLTPRISLRHSLRYDQGFPFDESLLPKVERFFAGGDTTLRGFDVDRARAEITASGSAPGSRFVRFRAIGGSLRILQNIDLQVRVAGPWHVGVFADNGVVADSFEGLVPSDFRHGAGVAPFVFKLPIGDISIAWGWPLDPQPGDTRVGRLHLNVGLMF